MGNERIENLIDRLSTALGGHGGVELVFGETRTVGDKAVIPVAKIGYGFGGGGGSGKRDAADETGEGAGFGGGINVKPVGFIEITPGGAEYKPIVDMAAILAAAAAVMGLVGAKMMLHAACKCRRIKRAESKG